MERPLIILRGNSGSGKTTVAKLLRERLGEKTMLVSQDVVRREILKVDDTEGNPSIDLIYEMCMYGNRMGRTVILEGILSNRKYGAMLRRLMADFDGPVHVSILIFRLRRRFGDTTQSLTRMSLAKQNCVCGGRIGTIWACRPRHCLGLSCRKRRLFGWR